MKQVTLYWGRTKETKKILRKGSGFRMHLTPNFTKEELRCPHCDKVDMDNDFMNMLQEARTIAGVPFHITSGYRCKEYNTTIGGVVGSSHLKGKAADIRMKDYAEGFSVLYGAIFAGFVRIGFGEGFIHVDNDRGKTQRIIWRY